MSEKVMILGGTSAIAQEVAKCYAASGADLIIVGRDESKLRVVEADLIARGAKSVVPLATNLSSEDAVEKIRRAAWGAESAPVTTVLLAYGSLTEQAKANSDIPYLRREIETNFTSAICLLTMCAEELEKRQSGSIGVISSVAGDRGRQSNYAYGAAKGGLTIFVAGLRNRLSKCGVNVVTVKPGFVDTPMTESFKKGPLWASPKLVGEGIFRALQQKRSVVYLPWFWSPIMMVIRSIPEAIFKKLSL